MKNKKGLKIADYDFIIYTSIYYIVNRRPSELLNVPDETEWFRFDSNGDVKFNHNNLEVMETVAEGVGLFEFYQNDTCDLNQMFEEDVLNSNEVKGFKEEWINHNDPKTLGWALDVVCDSSFANGFRAGYNAALTGGSGDTNVKPSCANIKKALNIIKQKIKKE